MARGRRPSVGTFLIGHLDPVETISGVQARLANLGHFAGAIDGEASGALAAAVAAFEREAGLDVTGDPNDGPMQSKLVAVHDGDP